MSYNPNTYYKVTFGPNVLHGRFDYPVVEEVSRSYIYDDLEIGHIDFIISGGPIVTFRWNMRDGAIVDSIEPWEETE